MRVSPEPLLWAPYPHAVPEMPAGANDNHASIQRNGPGIPAWAPATCTASFETQLVLGLRIPAFREDWQTDILGGSIFEILRATTPAVSGRSPCRPLLRRAGCRPRNTQPGLPRNASALPLAASNRRSQTPVRWSI